MKLLLVHHRLPWPLNNGMDKLRYNLIRTLSLSHELTLIVPVMGNCDEVGISNIKKYVKELILIPVNDLRDNSKLYFIKRLFALFFQLRPYYIHDHYSNIFNKKLKSYINNNNFDYINFLSDFSGLYLLSNKKQNNIILGPIDDNVLSYFEDFIDSKSLKSKIFSYINYILIKRFYRRILRSSFIVFFHSKEDLQRACSRTKNLINATVLPVATEIDSETYSSENLIPKSIIFVGGLGASFNVDAVIAFINQSFPIILEKIPEVKFYVVGNNPPPEIKKLHNNNTIIITGGVESVEPYLKMSSIYVAPIRRGTGIKTKMVEAMKYSKAIIATDKALQGLWAIDNEAVIINNDFNEMAQSCIKLLTNESIRQNYEQKSLKLYCDHYHFNKVAPLTLKIFNKKLESLEIIQEW